MAVRRSARSLATPVQCSHGFEMRHKACDSFPQTELQSCVLCCYADANRHAVTPFPGLGCFRLFEPLCLRRSRPHRSHLSINTPPWALRQGVPTSHEPQFVGELRHSYALQAIGENVHSICYPAPAGLREFPSPSLQHVQRFLVITFEEFLRPQQFRYL